MDITEAQQFIRHNHRAVLHTFRTDGRPQLSPVAIAIDGEGRVVLSTRETAIKVKNLRRDPWAAYCVITDEFYGRWLMVSGTVEIVALPEAMELLVDYYRSVAGEHPDWDDYRAAMERDKRVIVRMAIDSAGPTQEG